MIKDFPVGSFKSHVHDIAGIRPSDKEFRILPVEDEIVPVDMQVVEWKADKVVFMYFGNPAYKASVEINGVLKSADSKALSSLEVDHGVYEIAVSDLNFTPMRQEPDRGDDLCNSVPTGAGPDLPDDRFAL